MLRAEPRTPVGATDRGGVGGELAVAGGATGALGWVAASRVSSARWGSPSGSGTAPSADFASAMPGNRSSGALASIRRIAASSSAGQSGHRPLMGGGGASTCDCMTVSVEPVKGASPVIIS